jgi:hypothetical protein
LLSPFVLASVSLLPRPRSPAFMMWLARGRSIMLMHAKRKSLLLHRQHKNNTNLTGTSTTSCCIFFPFSFQPTNCTTTPL